MCASGSFDSLSPCGSEPSPVPPREDADDLYDDHQLQHEIQSSFFGLQSGVADPPWSTEADQALQQIYCEEQYQGPGML